MNSAIPRFKVLVARLVFHLASHADSGGCHSDRQQTFIRAFFELLVLASLLYQVKNLLGQISQV